MRLIDADAFKQQMSALALTSPSFFTSKVVKLLEIIDKQPTIDTEGVDKAYLEPAKENAELKKRLAAEEVIYSGIRGNKEVP